MADESETPAEASGVKKVGKLRIGGRVARRKRQARKKRSGLPDAAYDATGISKTSQEGHRAAGPIMQYGDDT